MFRKIIEWDKKRKFGHKFEDFIIIFWTCITINIFAYFTLKEFNLYIAGVTSIISVLLWNRRAPFPDELD